MILKMISANKLRYYLAQNYTPNQTIFKNTFWLFLAEFFRNGIRFLIQIFIARKLGAEGFGLFAFALSFAGIFAFLADFGFSTLVLRNIARDKTEMKEYFDNIIFIKTVLGLAVFLLIILSAQLLSFDESTEILIYLAGAISIINTFSDFFRSFFRAFEKMQWEAFSKIGEGILLALVIGFLIFNNAGLKEIFYGYIATEIIILIVNLLILKFRFLKEGLFKRYKINRDKIKFILKESLPLVFSAVFISIYYNIDQIMLGIISTKTELGYYSAAQRIIYGLSMFYMIILISFSPQITYFFKEDKKQLKLLLEKMNKIMLALAIPIGIGGTVFAPEIINFIFGNEYSRSIFAFQILIWSQAVVFVSACYGNALVMCNKQNKYLCGVALGAAVNIILNYMLIIKYSLYGAALATVITQLAVFAYMHSDLNKNIIKISFRQYIAKPLLASFIIILTLFYFKESFHIIALIFFGAIFYFSLLFKVLKFKI